MPKVRVDVPIRNVKLAAENGRYTRSYGEGVHEVERADVAKLVEQGGVEVDEQGEPVTKASKKTAAKKNRR